MQGAREINLLVIGRSGAGKSATTRLLTGDPAVRVANSLREVTTEVTCYEGATLHLAGQSLRFRVLDIPGLDRIANRAAIRERILALLEQHGMALDGIAYISSLTERDTIDESRLFGFLEALPWSGQAKREAVVPVLTKYDNLVLDSQEEEVAATEREFQELFERHHFAAAWGKRVYWVNHSKSLAFKMDNCPDIRTKHEQQLHRLVAALAANPHPLTAQAIRQTIEQEDRFILTALFESLRKEQLPFKRERKTQEVRLKVQVEAVSLEESVTAVSASSIAIAISKVCLKEMTSAFSLLLVGVPLAVALLKLASHSLSLREYHTPQASSGQAVLRSYEHISQEINCEMEREWQLLNDGLVFGVTAKFLECSLAVEALKFFCVGEMGVWLEEQAFERVPSPAGQLLFRVALPHFQESLLWRPLIVVSYHLKRFDEEQVMARIEALRRDFCATI